MQVRINGKQVELDAPTLLLTYLERLGVDPRSIAVEHNGEIIERSAFTSITLREGDKVEIVRRVNAEGVGVLVKYHWVPRQGVKNLTQAEAEAVQAKNFNHATQDLYEAIERGDFPQWELAVQIMEDGEHPELDFDPLDDTKRWPEDKFPLLAIGRMVLDRNPDNHFAETEQSAFGTGVLVDGIDFSDDKMLQGRTLSYSDTQRYRVGPNYLQLPINAPKNQARTNQRDGFMTYRVDGAGENKHVNYEPSVMGGLQEAPKPAREYHQWVEGALGRYPISRTAATTPRRASATAASRTGSART